MAFLRAHLLLDTSSFLGISVVSLWRIRQSQGPDDERSEGSRAHGFPLENVLCMFAPPRERSLLLARIRLAFVVGLPRRWFDHLVRKISLGHRSQGANRRERPNAKGSEILLPLFVLPRLDAPRPRLGVCSTSILAGSSWAIMSLQWPIRLAPGSFSRHRHVHDCFIGRRLCLRQSHSLAIALDC